jgi:hypothetical protein
MPYTLPLRDMPSFPAVQGKIANPDGTPTQEYVTFLRDLEEWISAARAALDEVEPP